MHCLLADFEVVFSAEVFLSTDKIIGYDDERRVSSASPQTTNALETIPALMFSIVMMPTPLKAHDISKALISFHPLHPLPTRRSIQLISLIVLVFHS